MAHITKANIFENSAVTLLARVRSSDGSYVQQADVSTITVKVYQRSTGDAVGSTLSPDPADVIFDTLQTDDIWDKDDTGYNFALTMDGSSFPSGDTVYRVEVKFEPVSGASFYAVWDLKSVNIYSE